MSTKLLIVWDGDVPGLADRRLSLTAFQPALRQLLTAIRRIATDIETKATGPRESARGRFAGEAAKLDVQISEVRGNSPLAVTASVLPIEAPKWPLIADLADAAVDEFLRDVERESNGSPTHYQVRRFLHALPPGLRVQRYSHTTADGTPGREVQLGAIDIREPRTAAHLIELVGAVVGLTFEQGRTEVKVRSSGGDLMTFAATAEQVDVALSHRHKEVLVLGVSDPAGKPRLLRVVPMSDAGDDRVLADPKERIGYITRTWDGVLTRLAR